MLWNWASARMTKDSRFFSMYPAPIAALFF
jgi:hypothetical protein